MKKTLPLLAVCLFAFSAVAEEPAAPLDATNIDLLREKAGQQVTVEGVVTTVGSTKDNTITFINIGLPKKQGFVAVVFQRSYGAFPNGFSDLDGKKVRVSGEMKLYQETKPQIELSTADQLVVVTE